MERINRSDDDIYIPNMWGEARALIFVNVGAVFLTLAFFVAPFRFVVQSNGVHIGSSC